MDSLADVCIIMLCVSGSMCLTPPLWLTAKRAWAAPDRRVPHVHAESTRTA